MENNIRFRNHISVIFEKVVKTSGIAIAAFVANFISDLEEMPGMKEILLLIVICIVCIILAFALHYFIWAKTYISIRDNALVIEKNTLNRKKNTIGISNISNVNLEQNLFEMALGTCKLKLDTNTLTTADETDVNIVLKKKDAEKFRAYLLGLSNTAETVEHVQKKGGFFTATSKEIFMHGIFSLNLVAVLLVLGVIGSVAPLVSELGNAEDMTRFDLILSILVLIWFIGGMIWKIVREFLRYLDFKIERNGDKVYLTYGIMKRVTYSIPVEKINAVRLNQTMLARLGKRYMVEVVNVGMGNDEEEQHSFFLPYAKLEKIQEQLEVLLPEFAMDFKEAERQPKDVWTVWAANGLMWMTGILPIAAIASELIGEGAGLVIAIAIVFTIYIALLRATSYLTDFVVVGENFLQISQGHFSRYLLFVKYEKIQYLTMKQCIVAKKFGIEKGQIHLLASMKNQIHNLPYMKEEMMKELKNYIR